MESEFPKRRLAAFDFDQTIVNDNTDTVIRALLDRKLITPEIQKLVESEGWTSYMQEIFRLVHLNKISPETIKSTITGINEVPGLVKCLKSLQKMNFDLIIISDANTEFIYEWNLTHGLSKTFEQIFTNPAHFDDSGLLIVRPFHNQTECNLSPANMCKGKILMDYIENREKCDGVQYENVFYIGDGSNDVCPVLKLTERDFGCPRKDFSMDKRMKTAILSSNIKIKPKLIRWSNGFDLLSEILRILKK